MMHLKPGDTISIREAKTPHDCCDEHDNPCMFDTEDENIVCPCSCGSGDHDIVFIKWEGCKL